MNKSQHYLLAATGLALCVCMLALTGARSSNAAPPPDKDVVVVNTAAQPVPVAVQGTATIAGTVSLASGSSIGINPSSNTVQLGNTVDNPVMVRDVDNPARQPFQEEFAITLPDNFGGENATFMVPLGKRLVIEYVSARGFVPAGQTLTFSIRTRQGNTPNGVVHYLVSTEQGFSGTSTGFVAGQVMRLYADPGTQVLVRAGRNPATGTGNAFIAVSGHFVDVP